MPVQVNTSRARRQPLQPLDEADLAPRERVTMTPLALRLPCDREALRAEPLEERVARLRFFFASACPWSPSSAACRS